MDTDVGQERRMDKESKTKMKEKDMGKATNM